MAGSLAVMRGTVEAAARTPTEADANRTLAAGTRGGSFDPRAGRTPPASGLCPAVRINATRLPLDARFARRRMQPAARSHESCNARIC